MKHAEWRKFICPMCCLPNIYPFSLSLTLSRDVCMHNGAGLIFRRIAKSMNSMMAFPDFRCSLSISLSHDDDAIWWYVSLSLNADGVRFPFGFVHTMGSCVLLWVHTMELKIRMQKYAFSIRMPPPATPHRFDSSWLTAKRVCIFIHRSPPPSKWVCRCYEM